MIAQPTEAQTRYWEGKLQNYKLSADRAERPEIDSAGVRTDRLVQMDRDADSFVTGPIVLPKDKAVAEVFAMDALGVSYPTEPKRFWPFPGAINRSGLIKTHRMGLVYGQEMPGEKETL